MKVSRGQIVTVDWQYSDRTGSKRRPALVVQADQYNAHLDDTILALVTSSSRRSVGAATQLVIDISTRDGSKAGLIINSVIQCENLATIDRQLILGVRGQLSPTMMDRIDECLRASLGLT
jgi:mRNA interferase MazF